MISELCTHDLGTGATRVVLRHDGFRVEAPNWGAEGFVVNGDGRLWRVPVDGLADGPALRPIDTGAHRACNNDHGVAGPDLWFSDKTETGRSCIYRMARGEAPRRVTAAVPSWWHSWSPAAGLVAYASVRDGGPVAIRACASDGSGEALVTDAFDHADGPDFTPDGRWIWFNGERDGRVDLWRVRPDGTGLERMTDGATVDWFPHPSPDGAHVLWLAYPPGTTGHPADLRVALRLMPQDGGEGREVLRLRGGQGSLNVPSWAPDGAAFAFMRYPE